MALDEGILHHLHTVNATELLEARLELEAEEKAIFQYVMSGRAAGIMLVLAFGIMVACYRMKAWFQRLSEDSDSAAAVAARFVCGAVDAACASAARSSATPKGYTQMSAATKYSDKSLLAERGSRLTPRSRQSRREDLREADDEADARGQKEGPAARLTRSASASVAPATDVMTSPASGTKLAENPSVLPGLEALSWRRPPDRIKGPSGRVFDGLSLCGLRIRDEPRRSAILFSETDYFDRFVLLVIVANCATMAWQSPLDPDGTWKLEVIARCEVFYLFVFTLEVIRHGVRIKAH